MDHECSRLALIAHSSPENLLRLHLIYQLASITAENILIPVGPQERYHQLVEEAYAALGLIETQVDALRSELEYQHKRLDEARAAAFAEAIERQE